MGRKKMQETEGRDGGILPHNTTSNEEDARLGLVQKKSTREEGKLMPPFKNTEEGKLVQQGERYGIKVPGGTKKTSI